MVKSVQYMNWNWTKEVLLPSSLRIRTSYKFSRIKLLFVVWQLDKSEQWHLVACQCYFFMRWLLSTMIRLECRPTKQRICSLYAANVDGYFGCNVRKRERSGCQEVVDAMWRKASPMGQLNRERWKADKETAILRVAHETTPKHN